MEVAQTGLVHGRKELDVFWIREIIQIQSSPCGG